MVNPQYYLDYIYSMNLISMEAKNREPTAVLIDHTVFSLFCRQGAD